MLSNNSISQFHVTEHKSELSVQAFLLMIPYTNDTDKVTTKNARLWSINWGILLEKYK